MDSPDDRDKPTGHIETGNLSHPGRSPRALLIAGPNGSGKTTFAYQFLIAEGKCPNFINADLIAAGLSPFRPEIMVYEASRLMLEQVQLRFVLRQDFSIETTLASRAYLRYIQEWQNHDYQVKLIFLELPDVDLAVQRVQQRVKQGGHDIPEDVIRRRFQRGIMNFHRLYQPVVNHWQIYDASRWPPVFLEEGVNK